MSEEKVLHRQIKQLRIELKDITVLESLNRELNTVEAEKVAAKSETRKQLKRILHDVECIKAEKARAKKKKLTGDNLPKVGKEFVDDESSDEDFIERQVMKVQGGQRAIIKKYSNIKTTPSPQSKQKKGNASKKSYQPVLKNRFQPAELGTDMSSSQLDEEREEFTEKEQNENQSGQEDDIDEDYSEEQDSLDENEEKETFDEIHQSYSQRSDEEHEEKNQEAEEKDLKDEAVKSAVSDPDEISIEVQELKEEIKNKTASPSKQSEDREDKQSAQSKRKNVEALNPAKPRQIESKKLKIGIKPQTAGQQLSATWCRKHFRIRTLEGHNDLVSCVYTDGDYLISAGRDTMVKIWRLDTCTEERTLSGHTSAITGVSLLKGSYAENLYNIYEEQLESKIVISASLDCSVRLWSFDTGRMLKSFYVYNALTSLACVYTDDEVYIVIGSDGGKIELIDLSDGTHLHSINAYDSSVNVIKARGSHIYCGSADGEINIYELIDKKLSLRYETENIRLASGKEVICGPIMAVNAWQEKVYYSDDGMNLKLLDWKKGEVKKLSNHLTEFGFTDNINIIDDNLVAITGFDIDNGNGYINVRALQTDEYICTIQHMDSERLLCMTVGHGSLQHKPLRIVTGGSVLQVWEDVTGTAPRDSDLIRPYHESYYNASAQPTPELSDNDSETDDNDVSDTGGRRISSSSKTIREEKPESSWSWWCTLT